MIWLRPRQSSSCSISVSDAESIPHGRHAAQRLGRGSRAWLEEAENNPKELEQRQRSDFLMSVNHAGAVAVFYSVRHAHGTALAEAGVAEKDIAASMHHASRMTTARYIHTDRKSVAKADEFLPDMAAVKQLATGTEGKAEHLKTNCLRKPAANYGHWWRFCQ